MLPLLTDLTRALRSLRRSPALVAVAVSSLALGIGVSVTIYSVVREMVLDDLSARQPDRLARVTAEIPYARFRDSAIPAYFRIWPSTSFSEISTGIRVRTAKLPGR